MNDIGHTQGQLDEVHMRQWAQELGILPRLEQTLADTGFLDDGKGGASL